MILQDALKTCKAIELMFYGFEPTKPEHLKGYVRADNKAFVSRVTPHVKDFVIELDTDACMLLDLVSYRNKLIRSGNKYRVENNSDLVADVKVNKELVTSTIQYLYMKQLVEYSAVPMSVKDPDYIKRMEEIDRTFDRFKIPDDNELTSLTVDKTYPYFNALSSMAYKEYPEVRKQLHKAYWELKDHFNLKGLESAPIKDNRLYIGISDADRERIKEWYIDETGYDSVPSTVSKTKYIVISKNPYDYYYCSYGSTFQSCFSLSSDYQGWLGMVPFSTQDSHYIVYGIDDTAGDINIIQGGKWKCPRMLFRCWGWTDTEGKLILDKCYDKDDNYIRAFKNTVLKPFINMSSCTLEIKDGKELYAYYKSYNLHTYFDSIEFNNNSKKFSFKFADGYRTFSGNSVDFGSSGTRRLTYAFSFVQSVDASVDMTKEDLSDMKISSDGVLLIPKRCPITHMEIPQTEEKSRYARHLNCPLNEGEDMAVITYLDGLVRLEALSTPCGGYFWGSISLSTGMGSWSVPKDMCFAGRLSQSTFNLKVLKEKLKQFMSNASDTNALKLILLRVIEDDKVTYIKYKMKGVKA